MSLNPMKDYLGIDKICDKIQLFENGLNEYVQNIRIRVRTCRAFEKIVLKFRSHTQIIGKSIPNKLIAIN